MAQKLRLTDILGKNMLGLSNKNPFLNVCPNSKLFSPFSYFAQILEEHGPLGAGDPLLLGQLDLFPPEARQRIQRSGGFRAFLLQSPRFVLMGEHIGLDLPAVSLQGARGRGLDHRDKLQPQSTGRPATSSPNDEYQQLLSLPCPYPYYADQTPSSRSASADCVSNSSGTTGSDAGVNTSHHFDHSSGSDSGDLEPKSSEVEENVWVDRYSPVNNAGVNQMCNYYKTIEYCENQI